jgi:hypothetical protein
MMCWYVGVAPWLSCSGCMCSDGECFVKVKVNIMLPAHGQLACPSWCQAPIWGPRLDFYYLQTVAGLMVWSSLSDKRAGLSFTIAADHCQQQSFSGRVKRMLMIIFYSLRFETPPKWRARSSYLYPPEIGWRRYSRRHWVSFSISTPPTTSSDAMQLFETARTRSTPSTRGWIGWMFCDVGSTFFQVSGVLLSGVKLVECFECEVISVVGLYVSFFAKLWMWYFSDVFKCLPFPLALAILLKVTMRSTRN